MKLLLWKWKFEFDFFNKLETKLQIWIVYANGNKALILETKLRFWKRSFDYGRKITVLCSIFTYLEEEKNSGYGNNAFQTLFNFELPTVERLF